MNTIVKKNKLFWIAISWLCVASPSSVFAQPQKDMDGGATLKVRLITAEKVTPSNSFLALKTNALLLAGGISNLGVEYGFKKISINIPVIYSPYTIAKEYQFRILAVQPEFRYWLNGNVEGHFFGVNGHVGHFNIAFDQKNRYQSASPVWGFGLNYGYRLAFSNHWGCEFTIGGGYANLQYDTFYNISDGSKFDTQKREYWGVTNVGINMIYRLNL